MDAIQVDPALRQGTDEKGDGSGFTRHTTSLWAQSAQKSYSLAPCHHLFVSSFTLLQMADVKYTFLSAHSMLGEGKPIDS